MQWDGPNSALSPIVHEDILPSMNTQYNTITLGASGVFSNV